MAIMVERAMDGFRSWWSARPDVGSTPQTGNAEQREDEADSVRTREARVLFCDRSGAAKSPDAAARDSESDVESSAESQAAEDAVQARAGKRAAAGAEEKRVLRARRKPPAAPGAAAGGGSPEAKRKRGRPPKSTPPKPEGGKRGRAPSSASPPVSKRKRGRPRKNAAVEGAEAGGAGAAGERTPERRAPATPNETPLPYISFKPVAEGSRVAVKYTPEGWFHAVVKDVEDLAPATPPESSPARQRARLLYETGEEDEIKLPDRDVVVLDGSREAAGAVDLFSRLAPEDFVGLKFTEVFRGSVRPLNPSRNNVSSSCPPRHVADREYSHAPSLPRASTPAPSPPSTTRGIRCGSRSSGPRRAKSRARPSMR